MMANLSHRIAAGTIGLSLAMAGGNATAAEVEWSGFFDVFVSSAEPVGATDSTVDLAGGGKATAFIGLGVTQEISPDLTAVADAQLFFRPQSGEVGRFGGDRFFARQAFTGIEGDFGTIGGGRVTAPTFLPMAFTNALGGSFNFSGANLHAYDGTFGTAPQLIGDSGWSNSVQYTTPDLNGFTANVIYGFGGTAGESGENRIGANFFFRGVDNLLVTGGFNAIDFGAVRFGTPAGGAGGSQTSALLGAKYDFGVAALYGQAITIDNDVDGGNEFSSNSFTLGVSVPAGPGEILLSGSTADAHRFGGFQEGGDRTTIAGGYDVDLGNGLSVYALAVSDDVSDRPTTEDTGRRIGVGTQFAF